MTRYLDEHLTNVQNDLHESCVGLSGAEGQSVVPDEADGGKSQVLVMEITTATQAPRLGDHCNNKTKEFFI